jgi:hypothetical protein
MCRKYLKGRCEYAQWVSEYKEGGQASVPERFILRGWGHFMRDRFSVQDMTMPFPAPKLTQFDWHSFIKSVQNAEIVAYSMICV